MTWQPIETAPKDGTVIMIHVTSRPDLPYVCRADDYWNGAWWLETATHWMPLPEPPNDFQFALSSLGEEEVSRVR